MTLRRERAWRGLTRSLTYYVGTTATGDPIAGPPSAAGRTPSWRPSPETLDYAGAASLPVNFEITASARDRHAGVIGRLDGLRQAGHAGRRP